VNTLEFGAAPAITLNSGQYISKFEFWHGNTGWKEKPDFQKEINQVMYGRFNFDIFDYQAVLVPKEYHRVNKIQITLQNQYGSTQVESYGSQ
jgi:hypothetical protein